MNETKKKSKLPVLLVLVVLLAGAYLLMNLQYQSDCEELIACLEQGDFAGADDAIGNVFFFRWKDEELTVLNSTIRTFLNGELGEASYYYVTQYADQGNSTAVAALKHLEPIAYERAVKAYADPDSRYNAVQLFGYLGNYENSADYVFVYEQWEALQYSNDTIADADLDRLVSLMGFVDVNELLVAGPYTALGYLAGIWNEEQSVGGFVLDDCGTASYDLPFVPAEGGTFQIKDGVFSLLNDSGEISADLYRFIPVSEDTVQVFCHANGQTYTLNKLLDY